MAATSKLSTACILLGLAAGAVLDDSSVLVQQSREQRALQTLPHTCSDREMEDFKAKVKKHQETLQEKALQRREKAQKDGEKLHAEADNRTTAFLQPMLDALDSVGKYLEIEVKPWGMTFVKGVLQKLFAGPLVLNQTTINMDRTRDKFLKEWDEHFVVHVRATLKEGFQRLHDKVDATVQTFTPEVQKLITSPVYPVHNESELQKYVYGRALPVMFLDSYPKVTEVAQMLATLPLEEKLYGAWLQKTLLPYLLKSLPDKCQPKRLITTVSLGFGDMGSRIQKFVNTCKTAMGIDVSEEPVRTCYTCLEHYQQQTMDMSVSGSCMTHCMPAVTGCISGVTDGCLHNFHPCMRCHSRKLQQLDKCEGNGTRKELAQTMEELSKVFKTASVEKNAVGGFLDNLFQAMHF